MSIIGRTAALGFLLLPLNPTWSQAQTGSALLDEYCLDCHNVNDWAGSLAMDTLDFNNPGKDAEHWELVVRKLRAGMMPPPGERRPAYDDALAFARTLEARLDATAGQNSEPPALHRLNRSEYSNAIRDLLALNTDVSMMLPVDNASEGFDNVASGLGSSPALIQGYVSAAQKIARLAVGDMSSTESVSSYNAPVDADQSRHVAGLPLGTRGGMVVRHYFPLDAEYRISVRGGAGYGRNQGVALDLTLDGQAVAVDNLRDFILSVPAGEHSLAVALVDHQRSAGVNDIYSSYSLPGNIGGIDITGPYNATSPGQTPARERIFTCRPSRDDEVMACARQILGNLASRAFREPVAETTLNPVMTFFSAGHQTGGFEFGIQQGLARILIDPRFLFRFEEEPAGLAAGTSYAIDDHELASRLSFFLWSSLPDQPLLTAAENGELKAGDKLRQEVRRLLDDERSSALVDNFAGQWLRLRELESLTPEHEDFNDNLRQAFITETRLLLASIIAEDRPVTDLLAANYTFLNERLAVHYGIDGIHGDYFRRVTLPEDSPRRGLLGQASLLTVTSTASRTSPVIRGSWILENLLHAPVPAPPPGVETNLDGDGDTVLTSSIRERLETHRENPACNACHSIIDPVGFALENFDMIGGWRTRDGDSPVDASGILADGTPVESPADLRQALMKRPELFVTTFTEKLLTYALGRSPEYYDMPQLRAIVRQAEAGDYRFTAIVDAIVTSPLFLQRTATGNSGTDEALASSHRVF